MKKVNAQFSSETAKSRHWRDLGNAHPKLVDPADWRNGL